MFELRKLFLAREIGVDLQCSLVLLLVALLDDTPADESEVESELATEGDFSLHVGADVLCHLNARHVLNKDTFN
jgi:hypothetical protein